jgi:hypothetical protein
VMLRTLEWDSSGYMSLLCGNCWSRFAYDTLNLLSMHLLIDERIWPEAATRRDSFKTAINLIISGLMSFFFVEHPRGYAVKMISRADTCRHLVWTWPNFSWVKLISLASKWFAGRNKIAEQHPFFCDISE